MKYIKRFFTVFFLSGVFFLLVFLLLIAFTIYLNGKTYWRTFAGKFDVSILSKDQALEIVQANLQQFFSVEFPVVFNDINYYFTPSELGIGLDSEALTASLDTIVSLESPVSFIKNNIQNKYYSLKPSVDLLTLKKALLEKIGVLRQSQNAYFEITSEGDLKIAAEKNGDRINLLAFIHDIEKNINTLKAHQIILQSKIYEPPVTAVYLESFKDNLLKKLNNPVKISYKKNRWDIKPFDKPNWFTISLVPLFVLEQDGMEIPLELENREDTFMIDSKNLPIVYQPIITLNSETFEHFADSDLRNAIEKPSSDVKVFYNKDNNIVFEGTAYDGMMIKRRQTAKSLQLAVNNNIVSFDIPTKALKARVLSDEKLSEIGIKNLIATGYSNFAGSTYKRIHNIQTSLTRYNGLLIPPGETFSFNKNLGAVDGKSGYLKELVITQNKTTPEYGGGICQVSSTIYRAAFFGGLPIVSRKAHSFAVSYYAKPLGYGLDATIYLGGQDLQFKNDTPGYILIQAYVSGNDLYIKFYGTDDDRKILTDGPYIANKKSPPPLAIEYTDELPPGQKKKTESAIPGFEATWYRTVIKGDKEEKETFFSRYRPWGEKILIGKEKEENTETANKVLID